MMARWRNWWLPHAARIDAISLRERILLFVTAVACVAALGYWGWLSPAQDAHGQLVRPRCIHGHPQQRVELGRFEMQKPARPLQGPEALISRFSVSADVSWRQPLLSATCRAK